jgi:hypothetical protein
LKNILKYKRLYNKKLENLFKIINLKKDIFNTEDYLNITLEYLKSDYNKFNYFILEFKNKKIKEIELEFKNI